MTPADWLGCPCKVHKDDSQSWDCRILLDGQPMQPGETRKVEIVFLSGEIAADVFRRAGKFFLWEEKIIGEAVLL